MRRPAARGTSIATLLILTAHPHLFTPRRLLEEARRSGFAAKAVTPREALRSAPADLSGDRLLARPGAFTADRVLHATRAAAQSGAHLLQARRSLVTACDQWRTLQVLRRAALPIPPTVLLRHPGDWRDAVQQLPGSTFFVKGRRGSKGSHVTHAGSPSAAQRAAWLLWGQGGAPLIQPDLRATGPVRRVLVARNEALVTLRATAAEDRAVSNWHQGGDLRLEDPKPAFTELAIAAARAIGLPLAGVDLIGEPEPVVLEVNASPGIEGAEQAASRNLAATIVHHLMTPHSPTL